MMKPIEFDTFQGVKVFINENGHFESKIDGASLNADDYRSLKEKIEQTLKNKKKAAKKVMSIKVINEELKTTTVTGIHARLGTLTMTPKIENRRRYGGSDKVWLDCEPAKKLLSEKIELNKRLEQIGKWLEKFAIEVEKSYGEVKDDTEYDRLVVDLEECAAAASRAANTLMKAAEKAVKHGA